MKEVSSLWVPLAILVVFYLLPLPLPKNLVKKQEITYLYKILVLFKKPYDENNEKAVN